MKIKVEKKTTLIKRLSENPLLKPEDVKSSREDFLVEGIFNCGAVKYNDEYILLCRVAEAVKTHSNEIVSFPIIIDNNGESQFEIITMNKNEHKEYSFTDPRTIKRVSEEQDKVVFLTSLSHLRIARSKDGINFVVDHKPTIMPNAEEESWGIEDPRITCIEDVYYINYSAVSPKGSATALITTTDFVNYERKGIIFLPENKDITIFPEKINNKYVAFNRPVPNSIGNPDIWLSESEDLIHWGGHKHFYGVSASGWENGRIGGGAPPFKTEKGWVKIYHAADRSDRYCLGVFLLDLDNPSKIIAKSITPLMEPIEDYETKGFFGNVVFTCGCIVENGIVKIYYGAADDKVCRADISIEDIYTHLGIK